MSGKLKVLALLNLIGWAIVVPMLVSSLVSPLLDYNASPDAVGSGQAGTTQLAPLSARPSGGGGKTAPEIAGPAGRQTGEQLPIPVRVLRQAGVATPVRTGPLTDGIPTNTAVRVRPTPGGSESVQIISTGVTNGAFPSLPDTPGTGTVVVPVVTPDPGTGEPAAPGPIVASPELPSPISDGGAGKTAEAPPLLGQIIVSEPTSVPTPEAPSVGTPEPTGTATPAPTDTATPVPTDTATPAPTDTATPAPTETATPVPTDTATPAPTDTATPAPTDTATPAPTDTATPAPTDTATPEPTDTATPAPTDTATPAPTDTATPAPTSTPEPPQAPGPDDPPSPQNRKAPLAVADRPKAVVEAKDDAPDDDVE